MLAQMIEVDCLSFVVVAGALVLLCGCVFMLSVVGRESTDAGGLQKVRDYPKVWFS